MQTLKAASAIRKTLATTLLAASAAYIAAARVVNGLSVDHAKSQPSWVEWLTAQGTVLLMGPLHWLASVLVFGKIRSALGIRDAGVCRGCAGCWVFVMQVCVGCLYGVCRVCAGCR